MKRQIVCLLSLSITLMLISCASTGYALGEKDKTVIYKVTHHSAAGELTTYTAYSIVAQEKAGYWLQRTTSKQPDSQPLSITQTLLDNFTHKPLRYIMHRPANMKRPANVIDLPLEQMGKDEILPTPITNAFADAGRIQVAAGTFAAKQGQIGNSTLWISFDVPVLGVIKVETPEWMMELVRIDPNVVDLLPQKPKKGGIVYLKEE
jgi:hypothetical protein